MGTMSILGRGWQFSKSLGPNIASRSIATKSLTDPSIAESADALKHVGEIERLQAERARQEREGLLKLDRGRSTNMTYSVVGTEKSEIVNNLLYATYHPDEPIIKHLGLYNGPNSIPDADKMVNSILKRNLSLFAYDTCGEVVGVCVNNAYFRSEFFEDLEQGLEDVIDPKWKPVMAVHHALRTQNTHIYDELRTSKFFSIRMVGVDPRARGKGVATDLIRRSVLLAGTLGFTGLKTEATGVFSQKAFRTIGMVSTNCIEYKDFEFEGVKVFEGMDKRHPNIAFMKKKFFQSCLKHII